MGQCLLSFRNDLCGLDNPFYKDQMVFYLTVVEKVYFTFPHLIAKLFYVIDHNVKKINYHAFDSCLQLQYVVIPTSVDVIEYQAFVDASFTIYLKDFKYPKIGIPMQLNILLN